MQHKALRSYRVETIKTVPRSLLFMAHREDPSWWGCLLLTIAMREEVEALCIAYEKVALPSEVIEMLGAAASAANPLDKVRDKLRTRRQSISFEYGREDIVGYLAGAGVSTLEQIHARIQLERLGKLDEEQLLLVSMLFWDGFTQEETAKLLGITRQTIRNRLNKIAELLGREQK